MRSPMAVMMTPTGLVLKIALISAGSVLRPVKMMRPTPITLLSAFPILNRDFTTIPMRGPNASIMPAPALTALKPLFNGTNASAQSIKPLAAAAANCGCLANSLLNAVIAGTITEVMIGTSAFNSAVSAGSVPFTMATSAAASGGIAGAKAATTRIAA